MLKMLRPYSMVKCQRVNLVKNTDYPEAIKSTRCQFVFYFLCSEFQTEMDRRKTLINEYKQREIIGGMYRVTNKRNGMYLLDYATNLQAKQNAFDFMVSSGSCFHYKLKKDWEAFGCKVFIFEILEALEKKKEQSQDEFVGDLRMLKQFWSEKLDSSRRY